MIMSDCHHQLNVQRVVQAALKVIERANVFAKFDQIPIFADSLDEGCSPPQEFPKREQGRVDKIPL